MVWHARSRYNNTFNTTDARKSYILAYNFCVNLIAAKFEAEPVHPSNYILSIHLSIYSNLLHLIANPTRQPNYLDTFKIESMLAETGAFFNAEQQNR